MEILKQNLEGDIEFGKATMSNLDEIISLYEERINWFKENGINQWSKYLINHPKEEFINAIKNEEYYMLNKDNEIIGGYQISTNSHLWNDTKTKAYYLYKVVTRVGQKNIGSKMFEFAKSRALLDKKEYLRLECLASNKKLNQLYENHGFKYIKKEYEIYHYNLRELKIES